MGFLPKSRSGWIGVACLSVLILGSGGVVGAKYGHNVFVSGQMAWENLVSLNPYAPVDRAELKKYAESHKPPKWVEEEGAHYTYKFDPRKYMADGPWCLQSGEPQSGNVASCTLAVMNLDAVMVGYTTEWTVQSVSAAAFGCGATISAFGYCTVTGGGATKVYSGSSPWPVDAQTAVADFVTAHPAPETWWGWVVIVYAAAATGDTTETTYLATGFFSPDAAIAPRPLPQPVWCGDTEWSLPVTFSIQNVKVMGRTMTDSSGTRTIPRFPTDISSDYHFQNGENCTSSVTFGGNTVTVAQTEDAEVWMSTFLAAINYAKAPTANLSYAEVQSIEIGGDSAVEVPTDSASFYSPNGEWFTATNEEPEDSHWHFFGDGNTFKLHRLEAASPNEDCQAWSTSLVRGPVRYRVLAGAMWPDIEGTGLPAGFRVDAGLKHWVDESTEEIVWLEPGLSDYYVMALWSAQGYGTYVYNKTGTYSLHECTPYVDADWLEANGLDLGNGSDGNDNAHPIIALHSLEAVLDSEDPYWGPPVTIQHEDVSIDIPPNEVDRPTEWAGSGGASTNPSDTGIWTVAEDASAPKITRTLASRYPIKMGILASWDAAYEGRPYGPQGANDGEDWIICNVANFDSAATLSAWPELAAIETEDVTDWDNSSYLKIVFSSSPAAADHQQFSLKIGYDIYDPTDPCYNCFSYRFGVDGEFDYEVTHQEATVYGTLDDGLLVFDLGLIERGPTNHLQHVTDVELFLPNVAGTYELEAATLAGDWRKWGETQKVASEAFAPQACPNPWKFKQDFHGFGCTVNGMNCLDIAYGYEQFEYVQRGLKGQQYAQYCPDMEDPPSIDPTVAKSLVRLVGELQYQQQFDAEYDNEIVDAATLDEDDNRLCSMYWWDLERVKLFSGKAAINCGTTFLSGIPYRNRTVTMHWSAYGCGHGLVVNGEGTASAERYRGGGGAYSTNPNTYAWKFMRKDRTDPEAEWVEFGSFEPDVDGRYITQPALETYRQAPPVGDEEWEEEPPRGYDYGIKSPGQSTVETISPFDTREFALIYVPGEAGGRDIYVVEHATNLIYVFEYSAADGIQHIYSSDAGAWYRDGIAKTPYDLPKTDVEPANTDGSPAGYVTKQGVLYLYHLKDNALHRLISVDWGGSWGEDATVIPASENLAKAVEFEYEGRQYCYGVDTSGNLYCYTSNTHFAETTYTLGTNKFLIVAGADETVQPGCYRAHGRLWAYTFLSDDRKAYVSVDFGKTWTLEA